MKDIVAISQSVCMVYCHVAVDLSVCKLDAIAVVDACTDIGNGLPLGAVVTTPEIAQVLTQRSHCVTFGGNPVCTAGGHAVLKVLDKEK